MGIRFLCPNGHKLNVKAYLAGERGICPQCDAKFLVPTESGGQVESIAEADPVTPAEPVSPAIAQQSAPAPPPPPSPTPPTAPVQPASEAPPEVWYVRTATGEQYGPAHVELMRQWVTEGRVTVDCFVWRTGWEDWKSGGQAITFLNVIPPDTATNVVQAAAVPPSAIPSESTTPAPTSSAEQPQPKDTANPATPSELPEPTNPTASYRSKKRLRQERARKVTLLLGVVVLLLFAVLIAVLVNNQ